MAIKKDRYGYEAIDDMLHRGYKIDDFFDRCDLCDELKFPQVGWSCEHDDPAHGTSICLDCLRELTEKYGHIQTTTMKGESE